MSYPYQQRFGGPAGQYQRQDSFDSSRLPPGAAPPGNYAYANNNNNLAQPPAPHRTRGPFPSAVNGRGESHSPVTRRQTVRGAVRGTVREAGVAPPPVRKSSQAPDRALTRGKTLTRPERFVAPAPLINPNNEKGGVYTTTLVNGIPTLHHKASSWDAWGVFVSVITFWAPNWLLSSCGFTDPLKQRAWKEKVALCTIAAVMMGVIGFITIGLNRVLCPVNGSRSTSAFIRIGTTPGLIGIQGWNFNISGTTSATVRTAANTLGGSDISDFFNRESTTFPRCTNKTAAYVKTDLCTKTSSSVCTLGAPTASVFTSLGLVNTTKLVGYDWSQLKALPNYLVIDGNVLNLDPYMTANPKAIANDPVDKAIRYVLQDLDASGGKDATRLFYNSDALKVSVNCLVQRYYAGHIDKITPGCFVSQLFLYISLVLIMGIVLARFFMACIYNWYLSGKLLQAPKNLKRHVISPAVLPEGANIDIDNRTGAAPWVDQQVKRQATQRLRRGDRGGRQGAATGRDEKKLLAASASTVVGSDGMISMASIGAELFCVCLVTCYSEGAEGIRSTLDSIAGTTYSDARKLIFVVCDGMITGEGEKMSTPDICVGMLKADPRFGEPQAMSYIAIGDGAKAHNQAMVYAGHYTNVKGHRTPTLVIVKCGPPEESKEKKPGNRGKRDSQMILMNFFSRVTYNDRMCPLDYDLFRKVQSLVGVTPDFFEVCLMVDADTKVYPESLGCLVRTMQNDNMIMGVCGETRIANKRQSWVTAIQVFEYFISHHLAKSFESVFGGVTCLPGCFSMYRLKARKSNDSDWFPILVQPQIISEYSQSVVTTLHQKNLLLLGEDRFLTTLLLRNFPNRKMMFCPQARCRTVAPDTFAVLLSQRRRWINSTIHNLMELVLVRSLCGSFCFSMQFILVVDLIGTVVLPIAICLTYTLIINYIFNPPSSFSDAIPLLLLGGVLGLPAVLILITTFKIVYVGWMLIYLIALPIWNFVLPIYAFSKFDDFSWGATRMVQGEGKGDDSHGPGTGVAQNVPLRRWEDWERSRVRKIKREEKRRREFERSFGTKQFHGRDGYEDSTAPSDTASLFSASDDGDRWGLQIGAYSEDGPTAAPPPVGLFEVDEGSEDHETIQAHEMEAVLEHGWTEEPRQYGYNPSRSSYGRPPSSVPPPLFTSPQKLYSLTDNPAPRMEKSSSSSSQQHLNSSTSSTSSLEYNPFNSNQPPSPSAYPLASSAYPIESRPSHQQSPGFSTGIGRIGGHAKQRSLSGGDPGEASLLAGRDGGRTPSPGRDWEYGASRRLT